MEARQDQLTDVNSLQTVFQQDRFSRARLPRRTSFQRRNSPAASDAPCLSTGNSWYHRNFERSAKRCARYYALPENNLAGH